MIADWGFRIETSHRKDAKNAENFQTLFWVFSANSATLRFKNPNSEIVMVIGYEYSNF